MYTLPILNDLLKIYQHKARQSREIETFARGQAEAFEEDAREVECAIQAEINRTTNGPNPADVHHDLPRV